MKLEKALPLDSNDWNAQAIVICTRSTVTPITIASNFGKLNISSSLALDLTTSLTQFDVI